MYREGKGVAAACGRGECVTWQWTAESGGGWEEGPEPLLSVCCVISRHAGWPTHGEGELTAAGQDQSTCVQNTCQYSYQFLSRPLSEDISRGNFIIRRMQWLFFGALGFGPRFIAALPLSWHVCGSTGLPEQIHHPCLPFPLPHRCEPRREHGHRLERRRHPSQSRRRPSGAHPDRRGRWKQSAFASASQRWEGGGSWRVGWPPRPLMSFSPPLGGVCGGGCPRGGDVGVHWITVSLS